MVGTKDMQDNKWDNLDKIDLNMCFRYSSWKECRV